MDSFSLKECVDVGKTVAASSSNYISVLEQCCCGDVCSEGIYCWLLIA